MPAVRDPSSGAYASAGPAIKRPYGEWLVDQLYDEMLRCRALRAQYRGDIRNARKALEVAMENYEKNEETIVAIGMAQIELKEL